MHRATTLSALLIASGLSAQKFTDTFPLDTTPGLPPVLNWTPEGGTSWQVVNGRLSGTGSGWRYITANGLTATNCVLDVEAFFVAGGIQFAGLTARFTGANSTLMCKIQQNSTASSAFDRAFLYNRGGLAGNTYADLSTKVQSAYCRMIVVDNQHWMQMDLDKDGVYDQTLGPRNITTINGSGKLGLNSYGVSELDNFEFFDAVLMPQANATPKVGTTYNMDLHTTATSITPYRFALSAGNKGFALGPYRIPLDPDPLFDFSLTFTGPLGLSGVTDASGKATVGLVIPNVASAVGAKLFIAGITLDGTQPMGIGNITNELSITIQ